MATKITSDVLESYLRCKFKGHLKLAGQKGTTCDYEALLTELRAEVRLKAIDAIIARHPGDQVARNIPLTAAGLKQGPQYILDGTLEGDSVSLHFDGLKKVDGPSKLGTFHYVPVLFHEGRQVRKEQRLLLEVYGFLLAKLQGRVPAYGVVWHGRDCKTVRVRLNADQRKAEHLLRKVEEMAEAESPPKLILNNHCQLCEFQRHCHAQATKDDDLSLLRGMSEKELTRHNRRGIFTVTQLSYTFRPKRKSKRAKCLAPLHHYSLQALAIRDCKVYMFQKPDLPNAPVRVYLDVEGDAEGLAYLVGVTIDNGGTTSHQSLWLDDQSREDVLLKQLLSLVGQFADYRLYHYGAYEADWLKRVRRVSGNKKAIDLLLRNSVNVASLIRSRLYFPTYSRSLKAIGEYLGCRWTHKDASGLQSLAWRARWEQCGEEVLKQTLLTYNAEDCAALKRLTDFMYALTAEFGTSNDEQPEAGGSSGVIDVGDLIAQQKRRRLGSSGLVFEEFSVINKCSYFDYQREKVVARIGKRSARPKPSRLRRKAKRPKANKRVEITCRKCPFCKSANLSRYYRDVSRKYSLDLRITAGGVRRFVIKYSAATHHCLDCKRNFIPPKFKAMKKVRYCRTLMAWTIYQHVQNRTTFENLVRLLRECFGLVIPLAQLFRFKSRLAKEYRGTYRSLLDAILSGGLMHADETAMRLKKDRGYVWVFTNLNDVVYMYKDTREGLFLHEMLKNFSGVLVSDFFSAYDSVKCKQQKCLIHLMRDLNDDLEENFFDEELKALSKRFGQLLVAIVGTIDSHGLAQRHLSKHKKDVEFFYASACEQPYQSEIAERYRKRFVKYKDKLFVFLDHDGVPWNNNNAEHAVKYFAKYRVISNGHMTESGITDYLLLLSIYQSCAYRGLSFLDFLLSGEVNLARFSESRHGHKCLPD